MAAIWLGERWINPTPKKKEPPSYGDPVTYAGDRHLTMFGPNGSGKGVTIEIPNLLWLGNDLSIVSIDPKGQNAAVTAAWRGRLSDVWVLNPFGLHVGRYPDLASIGFNPLTALDPNSDRFFDKARALAEALIRVEGDSQPFFPQSAQGLVTGLIMWEVITAQDAGRTPSLPHVRDLLMSADQGGENSKLTGLQITAARMAHSSHSSVANLGRMFTRDGKEIASVVSTAVAQTHWLESAPMRRDLEKGVVRFGQLKEKPTTVYVILPAGDLDNFSEWLRLVITMALGELYERNGEGLPVLFMLSEFAALGKLKPITTALGQARGYGIQLFPVLQDINQLRGIYGNDFSHTFLGMSGATIAFTPNDLETAEWMSRRSGHELTATPSYSDNRRGGANESWSFFQNRIYSPDLLFGLKNFHALTWFAGESGAVAVRCRRYWELPFCMGRYRKDPFHS